MARDHLSRLQATMESAAAFADSLVGLPMKEAERLAASDGKYIEIIPASNIVSADLDAKRIRVRLNGDEIVEAKAG
ncbi:hypothetical protein [Nocardioides iriomotensis]|uniref:Peptidase inhibitor I78 family protein n=1 Tax=Nocardioides iriomotensis TaxID=715784 RepID=A0A4Q5IY70_9ACTN|nr:hypothetical protein [Nocardioides iriomotensis]RYU09865.1 hypothetical protein ETU37_18665 [Nocardioides iriomotensis]